MYLVVGLGNPGSEYVDTRHNVGHAVVRILARRHGASLQAGRLGSTAEIVVDGQAVIATLNTYMNVSGPDTAALARTLDIPTDAIIAIHDDLDLALATVRIKVGGGSGGHHGVDSLIEALGAEFVRVRVGIGRPPGKMEPTDFVLKPFTPADFIDAEIACERAADAVETILREGVEKAMWIYNRGGE